MTKQNTLVKWKEWRTQPVVIHGILHAALFMTIFIALGHLFYYGPGDLESHIANQIISGKIPYINFPSEYPPLAYITFLLPALLFREQPSYSFAFAFELLMADIVILAIIASLARRLKLSVSNTLLLYTLLILTVGPLVITRYDLLPAMLTLAAMYAFVSGRSHAAWSLIALGAAAKLYPVIVAPLFALYHLRQKQYGRLIAGGGIFVAVILLAISPWLVLNARSLLTFINYHAQRGLHSESTYGTVLLVMQVFKAIKLQATLTFGSWNLISPVADRLAGNSFYVTAIAVLAVYALYAWQLYKTTGSASGQGTFNRQSTQLMIIFASLVVTVFLLTNKVFSPQYLVWLCPLLPLVAGRWRLSILVLFPLAAAFTQYIFPYHYIEFEMFRTYLVFMAFARNVMLAAVMVLLILSAVALSQRRKKHAG